jgi:TRAP-type C4-dicarboxylate transport system permease small subunit
VKAFLEGYARLLAAIGRVELGVARLCLGAIVLCIFAQVVSRYGFNRPLVWVEEFATYCFIWGTFVGASLGLKQGLHIKVETFLGRLAPGARQVILCLTQLAIGVFCLLLIVNGVKAMLLFEWGQRTIALPIELPRYLFFSGPLILASASMLVTVVHDLLSTATGRPPRPGRDAPVAA